MVPGLTFKALMYFEFASNILAITSQQPEIV